MHEYEFKHWKLGEQLINFGGRTQNGRTDDNAQI